ncbi:hypothetical protein HOY80DRAFT_1043164 [Tuber brumale]|nr:hypothetical protein HOY80DRAFT_1043164 [Tuber brumale]
MHLGVLAHFLHENIPCKGYSWLSSTGLETFEKIKWRLQCARCPSSPVRVYSDFSTKDLNNDVSLHHGAIKDRPDTGRKLSLVASKSRIVEAFGHKASPSL